MILMLMFDLAFAVALMINVEAALYCDVQCRF